MPTWVCFFLIMLGGMAHAQEFEVASVKLGTLQKGTGVGRVMAQLSNRLPPGSLGLTDPGRLRMTNIPLQHIIAAAWRVRDMQVAGPEWMEGETFTVEAKVPEGTPKDQVNEMLQKLLVDRFGLSVHEETRTFSGYALVVAKSGPKLTASGPVLPNERPTFPTLPEVSALQSGTHSRLGRITIEAFAADLWSEIGVPVLDMTGIRGIYDIVLETRPDTPDEPGITMFDAVGQLGLRLESRKVPVRILVVDQVSRTPTAN
jgi:uncharacterized protein (TIGR03435 family)